MNEARLNEMDAELRALIEERIGPKARDLKGALGKAGRRLPKGMRARGDLIVDAQSKAGHPHLQAQLDGAQIEKAHARLKEHLQKIDRREMRIRSAIRIGSGLAFNLLVLVAAVIVLLRLRGFV